MDKQINLEDTLFILNVRMRMIRDLLQLDTDADLFLPKSLEDMVFTGYALQALTAKLVANSRFMTREMDNLSDTEWQFSRLLDEFSGDSSPFRLERFPETGELIAKLREESAGRRKLVDESTDPPQPDQYEPRVSHAELSGLLGNNQEFL